MGYGITALAEHDLAEQLWLTERAKWFIQSNVGRPWSEHARMVEKVPERLAGLFGVELSELDVRAINASGADLTVAAGLEERPGSCGPAPGQGQATSAQV